MVIKPLKIDKIRFLPAFEISLFLGETLLSGTAIFVSHFDDSIYHLVVVMIMSVSFAVFNLWAQPCRGKSTFLNAFRSGAYCAAVWACTCSLVVWICNSTITNIYPQNAAATFPMVMYIVGVVPIFFLGFFLNYRNKRHRVLPDIPFEDLLRQHENTHISNAMTFVFSIRPTLDLTFFFVEDEHATIITRGIRETTILQNLRY
jgi:hypothetical protein